jgi:hypothetical protein
MKYRGAPQQQIIKYECLRSTDTDRWEDRTIDIMALTLCHSVGVTGLFAPLTGDVLAVTGLFAQLTGDVLAVTNV